MALLLSGAWAASMHAFAIEARARSHIMMRLDPIARRQWDLLTLLSHWLTIS